MVYVSSCLYLVQFLTSQLVSVFSVSCNTLVVLTLSHFIFSCPSLIKLSPFLLLLFFWYVHTPSSSHYIYTHIGICDSCVCVCVWVHWMLGGDKDSSCSTYSFFPQLWPLAQETKRKMITLHTCLWLPNSTTSSIPFTCKLTLLSPLPLLLHYVLKINMASQKPKHSIQQMSNRWWKPYS